MNPKIQSEPILRLEVEIQSDPTLRFILRESQLDSNKIDDQITLRQAAFIIALNRSIDKLHFLEL
jgi:hypothetical protein